MAKDDTDTSGSSDGRRAGERRQAQQPFEGPDRRKGDRRTGEDRRAKPRA